MNGDWAGKRLGDLELLHRLGSGGMGEVWLARQEGLGREVAVKILPHTTDQRAINRLRREAHALAQIRHSHVVPVHEVGEQDGIALRHATALAPDDAHAWYALGYSRFWLGDLPAARAALERAVADPAIERRYPKQGGPAIFLARIAARERDPAATERWLAEAVRLGGNLDVARHDPALRELLGARLRVLTGD
jgi:hypothetical protein